MKKDNIAFASASGQRPSRRNSNGGTLLGMFIGLVTGLVIAFAVVWYLNKTPLPFQDRAADEPHVANSQGAATPAPLPGKPGDKPRFEFYGILEGKQQATPGAASGAPSAAPAVTVTSPSEVKPVDVFFLQVGAFQKTQDVDKLKAKLALMGLEASVQEISVADKGVMQRVRVGPFRSPEEMNRARTALAQGGVQTTVVKQKEPPAQ